MSAAYFTPAELRAAHPDLANAERFKDAALEAARVFAEQWFEAAAHVAYVPREVTELLTGTGSRRLFLSHWTQVREVKSVAIDGRALSAEEIAALSLRAWGVVERAGGWPAGATVEIAYSHGYDAVAAGPFADLVKGAVMTLAAEHAKPATIPARATSIATDLGSYRISQADATGKTGIPDVDAVIGLVGAAKPTTGAGA